MYYQALKRRLSLPSFLLSLVLAALFLTNCASKEGGGEDPEGLYNEADDLYKDERFLMAIEKYRDLKNKYPYSSRATDAELRIADSFFEQESFLEAESAYEIFKELHPTHPRSDYVQYRIGLSYFKQIPENAARDLTAAYRAIESFEVLAEKYPSSEFVAKAKEQSVEAKRRLADHENYVADFYFRRRHFLSATYRYNALLKDFPNLGYDEEALFRLGQCYVNVRMFGNAKDAFNRLLTQFPESSLKAEVTGILEDITKKSN